MQKPINDEPVTIVKKDGGEDTPSAKAEADTEAMELVTKSGSVFSGEYEKAQQKAEIEFSKKLEDIKAQEKELDYKLK